MDWIEAANPHHSRHSYSHISRMLKILDYPELQLKEASVSLNRQSSFCGSLFFLANSLWLRIHWDTGMWCPVGPDSDRASAQLALCI